MLVLLILQLSLQVGHLLRVAALFLHFVSRGGLHRKSCFSQSRLKDSPLFSEIRGRSARSPALVGVDDLDVVRY